MRYLRLSSLALLLALIVTLTTSGTSAQLQSSTRLYLPLIRTQSAVAAFGVETNLGLLSTSVVRARAAELGATWVRINGVRWQAVQPTENSPYDWSALAALDRDLNVAQALGMTPTVVIRGAPSWAAVEPASFCSAIREDRLGAYAAFLEALAARYRNQVVYWELGNEPDVDPGLVPSDSPFGCLGDVGDLYYGGERYGRMLQVATPALRRGNPNAKIIFGGLLLSSPSTTDPNRGNPERFFEGALRAGGANAFDILAYHSYPTLPHGYQDDIDLRSGSGWDTLGGHTLGKAQFLRSVMASYGVQKPLWLNETSLITCDPASPPCPAPDNNFFQAQAAHAVRVMARAIANDVQMVAWYPLNYTSWRNASLIDAQQQPKPVFNAYKYMIATTSPYRNVTAVNYGPEIEAYRFNKGTRVVDVLWRRSPGTSEVRVALTRSPLATNIDGLTSAPGRIEGSDMVYTVGFTPIYIERQP